MAVRVLATPGHTYTHLSYGLLDASTTARPRRIHRRIAALRVDRPPRLARAPSMRARWPARSMPRPASSRRRCPNATPIYPTHGFGSFCSATPTLGNSSTIGAERPATRPCARPGAIRVDLAGLLDAYPAYYAHMAPANAAGPTAADLTPPPGASAELVRKRIAAGEWVVDLRHRQAFAAGHVPGTFGFELSDNFATYLGWLIPWGSPLTLLTDSADEAAAGQRQLARIGISVSSAVIGPPELLADDQPLAAYPVSDFAGLAEALRRDPITVLDVRRRSEWETGHLHGAAHIPLHDLPGRLAELPSLPVWVHCQAGYRAAIAASILQAAGQSATAIDDDLARAANAGLTLSRRA